MFFKTWLKAEQPIIAIIRVLIYIVRFACSVVTQFPLMNFRGEPSHLHTQTSQAQGRAAALAVLSIEYIHCTYYHIILYYTTLHYTILCYIISYYIHVYYDIIYLEVGTYGLDVHGPGCQTILQEIQARSSFPSKLALVVSPGL